jgi:[ribosomal protein S5]-alanine N-acetyltransferase
MRSRRNARCVGYNQGVDRLETPRLHLRPFGAEDAPVAHEVYSDPEVMRYVATGPLPDLAMTRRLLHDYTTHQEAYGYSFWAVLERASGRLIGDAGLYRTPIGEVELGYTLGKAWWGRGYATEAAGAWLQAAFSRLEIPEVVALAEPANAASLRVLEKLGMTRDGERIAFGRPHAVYRATRPVSAGHTSGRLAGLGRRLDRVRRR